jgi:hypothetical protein
MNINDELTRKIAAIAQGIMSEDNTNKKSDDGEGLDKVQPKAVKKNFDDRKDKDIDNDGDVDSSDEYIHAKRKAISKAIKSESTDLEEGDMNKLDRLKGIAARKKELEATISRLRATHSKDTGDDRVSTMRAIDMNKELLKKVIANEKKVKGLKESEDLEEATELYKKGKISLTKFAMGKGKGSGLQINYGPLKFIQVPEKEIKQLQDALVYVTKSVPQFKESTEDLEEATMSQGVKTAATQIYSLEKSLKVGSNLNKGINKSLEGKYDADFKKMQKAIGDIITVWEEIERDFSDINEGVDLEKAKILTPDEYDEVQNFKNFNKKDWKWNAIQKKFIRK